LLVLGADHLPAALRTIVTGRRNQRATVAAVRTFAALNAVALLVMTFKPSTETAVVFRRLYEESLKGPLVSTPHHCSPTRWPATPWISTDLRT
jgi:hypothetical protein